MTQLSVHCADLEAFAAAERWLLALRGSGNSSTNINSSGSGRDDALEPNSDGAGAGTRHSSNSNSRGRLMSQVSVEATCAGCLHCRLADKAAERRGTSATALAHALVGLRGDSAAAITSTTPPPLSSSSRTLETLLLPLTLFVSQSGERVGGSAGLSHRPIPVTPHRQHPLFSSFSSSFCPSPSPPVLIQTAPCRHEQRCPRPSTPRWPPPFSPGACCSRRRCSRTSRSRCHSVQR